MEWSPSKIIRIEAGSVGVSANDMKELLRLYNITDSKRVNELITLARVRPGNARPPTGTRPRGSPQFIDYEAAAGAIDPWFQPSCGARPPPDEECARAVIQAVH